MINFHFTKRGEDDVVISKLWFEIMLFSFLRNVLDLVLCWCTNGVFSLQDLATTVFAAFAICIFRSWKKKKKATMESPAETQAASKLSIPEADPVTRRQSNVVNLTGGDAASESSQPCESHTDNDSILSAGETTGAAGASLHNGKDIYDMISDLKQKVDATLSERNDVKDVKWPATTNVTANAPADSSLPTEKKNEKLKTRSPENSIGPALTKSQYEYFSSKIKFVAQLASELQKRLDSYLLGADRQNDDCSVVVLKSDHTTRTKLSSTTYHPKKSKAVMFSNAKSELTSSNGADSKTNGKIVAASSSHESVPRGFINIPSNSVLTGPKFQTTITSNIQRICGPSGAKFPAAAIPCRQVQSDEIYARIVILENQGVATNKNAATSSLLPSTASRETEHDCTENGFKLPASELQQIQDDEAIARALQNEENVLYEQSSIDTSDERTTGIAAVVPACDVASVSAVSLPNAQLNAKLSAADTAKDQQLQDDEAIALALQNEEANNISEEAERIAVSNEACDVGMATTATGKAWQFVERVLEYVSSSSNKFGFEAVATDDLVFMAKRMFEAQEDFLRAGAPTGVDIGYHYTNGQNMSNIRADGLLTRSDQKQNNIQAHRLSGATYGEGIYTGDNPSMFQKFGDVGLVVARLKGLRMDYMKSDRCYRNGNDSISKRSSGLVVLQRSSQCVAMLQYKTSSMEHRLHFHESVVALKRVVDETFNRRDPSPPQRGGTATDRLNVTASSASTSNIGDRTQVKVPPMLGSDALDFVYPPPPSSSTLGVVPIRVFASDERPKYPSDAFRRHFTPNNTTQSTGASKTNVPESAPFRGTVLVASQSASSAILVSEPAASHSAASTSKKPSFDSDHKKGFAIKCSGPKSNGVRQIVATVYGDNSTSTLKSNVFGGGQKTESSLPEKSGLKFGSIAKQEKEVNAGKPSFNLTKSSPTKQPPGNPIPFLKPASETSRQAVNGPVFSVGEKACPPTAGGPSLGGFGDAVQGCSFGNSVGPTPGAFGVSSVAPSGGTFGSSIVDNNVILGGGAKIAPAGGLGSPTSPSPFGGLSFSRAVGSLGRAGRTSSRKKNCAD